MKNIAFFNLILVLNIFTVVGQIPNDSLFVKKFHGYEARQFFNTKNKFEKALFKTSRETGYYIYKSDKKFLSVGSAEWLMKQDADAYRLIMSAKSLTTTRKAIEWGGTIGVGIYAIASPSYGEDTQENIKTIAIIFGTEIGILIISASFRNAAFHRTRDAALLYNYGLKNTSKYPETALRVGFTGNGIGLKVLF